MLVLQTKSEVGITKTQFIKQVFDVANRNGDKVAVDVSKDLTYIYWTRESKGLMFGVKIPKELTVDEQAYESARTYNLTLDLGIAEPNIL